MLPAAIPGRTSRKASPNAPRWETTSRASAPSRTYQGESLRERTQPASGAVQHARSHTIAENHVEGMVTKLNDVAGVAFNGVKRVMPQARALKDHGHARGDSAGQVHERDFEWYRDMLPNHRSASKIEHSHPRLHFYDFN